jgi:hypothetical protein
MTEIEIASPHDARSYGVHTNPQKSRLVTFVPEDKLIVLSEN